MRLHLSQRNRRNYRFSLLPKRRAGVKPRRYDLHEWPFQSKPLTGRDLKTAARLLKFDCRTFSGVGITLEVVEPRVYLLMSGSIHDYGLFPRDRHVDERELYAPSERQWRRFWKELDRCGFWRWKRSYRCAALDGTSWYARVRRGRSVAYIQGSNGYPRGFRRFWEALERLIGRPLPSPIPTRLSGRRGDNVPYAHHIFERYRKLMTRTYDDLVARVIEQVRTLDGDRLDLDVNLWDAFIRHMRWDMNASFWTRECTIKDVCEAVVSALTDLEVETLWMMTAEFLDWGRDQSEPLLADKRSAVTMELFKQTKARAERLGYHVRSPVTTV